MKKLLYIIIGLMGMMTVQAQNPKERIQVQTDKDFYLAGEKMGLKLYGIDDQGKALEFSRVVYVELLGDKNNVVQLKVEMNNATGEAIMQLPYTLASGVYDLVAYTRWMRNEGEGIFSRQKIAVFNSLRYAQNMDCINFVDGDAPAPALSSNGQGLQIKTDKSQYDNREAVKVSIDGMPQDATFSVSIVRQDVTSGESTAEKINGSTPTSGIKYLPELEGLIIDSELNTKSDNKQMIRPNMTIQGNDVHYYAGQVSSEGKLQFYTTALQGVTEVVTGMTGEGHLELLTPFVATPPAQMRPITLYRSYEESLTERSVALQATDHFFGSTSPEKVVPEKQFPFLNPKWIYDLDHYKRFPTFEETFIEFMPCVSTLGSKGNRRIVAFDSDAQAAGTGNTLVLLDGVAIMDHELLLAYDPHLVKYVEVFVEDFAIGNQLYNGILSIKTPNRKLSGFTLPSTSVMCEYEGVQAPTDYLMPSASKDVQANLPDFRHTLYWNPNVTANNNQLECRTSDMCGTYIVKVTGRTSDGKIIQGQTSFDVK